MTEILRLASGSDGAPTPVFAAMLDKLTRLSRSDNGIFWRHVDGLFDAAVLHNIPPAPAELLRRGPTRPAPGTVLAQLAAGAVFATAPDVEDSDLDGVRSSAAVALRKDGVLLGAIQLYRKELRPFAEREIALVSALATQVALAMDHARLFNELRQSTQDLREALEFQTATSEALQAINRAAFDLHPALAEIAATAARLCRVEMANIYRRDGDLFHYALGHGIAPEYERIERANPMPLTTARSSGEPRSRAARCRSPMPGPTRPTRGRTTRGSAMYGRCWACRCCARECRSAS
jgi:hypothetical protein